MTKLSFVALSLQTTHLDPASLSKAAYVKIVDGNVTRQAEMTIASPTAEPPAEEHDDVLAWDVALEKLGMVIGRLPIVSYYRDADKEIFQTASRHLDITPPEFHWLDCRELVRQQLPDLPDTQLSTVLKALDLYDDYADATTVQQTGQVVIALAQRQHATTADQLWNDLYHQPDDPLGLNNTFQGIASIDGTADDSEDLSARQPAATVLPITGSVPLPAVDPIAQDHPDASQAPAQQDSETTHVAVEARSDIAELLPTSDVKSVEESPEDEATESLSHEPSQASDQDPEVTTVEADETSAYEITGVAGSPTAVPEGDQLPEIPLFLQQAPREETAASEPGTEIDETGETPVAEPTGAENSAPESVEDVSEIGDQEPAEADDTEEVHTDQRDVDQPDVVQRTGDLEQIEDPDGLAVDDDADKVGTLNEPEAGGATEPLAGPEPGEASDESSQEVQAEQRESTENTTSDSAEKTEPLPKNQPEYVASVALDELPATVEKGESESVGDTMLRKPRSAAARILSFFGILLFGVLTVVGVALTVLAVMLFFTTNTLILETKIAGVLLTLAITLLAALMTHASYRKFRKR